MEKSRIRIANPLKTVILIPNSTWDRGRVGYITKYCTEICFPDVPVVVMEDTWKKSGYDGAWYGAHKQHDSIYEISKSEFESVIYVQDDVALAKSIYKELLLCEYMWETFSYNRQKLGLLILPGYITWTSSVSTDIDINLYRICEQINSGYCYDICRFGGQVMIGNRELLCKVLRLWHDYKTCLFDDLMWRQYSTVIINMVPSLFQHKIINSTWKKRDYYFRTVDMARSDALRARFSEMLEFDSDSKSRITKVLSYFWDWVMASEIEELDGEVVHLLNEEELCCIDRIIRKISWLTSGQLGETIWHNYQLFRSNLAS